MTLAVLIVKQVYALSFNILERLYRYEAALPRLDPKILMVMNGNLRDDF